MARSLCMNGSTDSVLHEINSNTNILLIGSVTVTNDVCIKGSLTIAKNAKVIVHGNIKADSLGTLYGSSLVINGDLQSSLYTKENSSVTVHGRATINNSMSLFSNSKLMVSKNLHIKSDFICFSEYVTVTVDKYMLVSLPHNGYFSMYKQSSLCIGRSLFIKGHGGVEIDNNASLLVKWNCRIDASISMYPFVTMKVHGCLSVTGKIELHNDCNVCIGEELLVLSEDNVMRLSPGCQVLIGSKANIQSSVLIEDSSLVFSHDATISSLSTDTNCKIQVMGSLRLTEAMIRQTTLETINMTCHKLVTKDSLLRIADCLSIEKSLETNNTKLDIRGCLSASSLVLRNACNVFVGGDISIKDIKVINSNLMITGHAMVTSIITLSQCSNLDTMSLSCNSLEVEDMSNVKTQVLNVKDCLGLSRQGKVHTLKDMNVDGLHMDVRSVLVIEGDTCINGKFYIDENCSVSLEGASCVLSELDIRGHSIMNVFGDLRIECARVHESKVTINQSTSMDALYVENADIVIKAMASVSNRLLFNGGSIYIHKDIKAKHISLNNYSNLCIDGSLSMDSICIHRIINLGDTYVLINENGVTKSYDSLMKPVTFNTIILGVSNACIHESSISVSVAGAQVKLKGEVSTVTSIH